LHNHSSRKENTDHKVAIDQIIGPTPNENEVDIDLKYIRRVRVPESRNFQKSRFRLFGKNLTHVNKINEESESEKHEIELKKYSPAYYKGQSTKERPLLQSKSPFVKKMSEFESSRERIRAAEMIGKSMLLFPSLMQIQNFSPNVSVLHNSNKNVLKQLNNE
jgi:hypothetical protein